MSCKLYVDQIIVLYLLSSVLSNIILTVPYEDSEYDRKKVIHVRNGL